MTMEARPQWKSSSNLAYGVLLIVGLICFYFVYGFSPSAGSTAVQPGQATQTPSGAAIPPAPRAYLNQTAGARTIFVGGFAMALITVSLFELLKLGIQYLLYNLTFRARFDQFFGDNASSRSKNGIIYLQSDTVPGLLTDLLAGNTPDIEMGPQQRCYKARCWVNRWDAEGARQLRERFQFLKMDAPELRPIDRGADMNIPAEAPYVISMGLGFTDNTKHLTSDLPWLRIACSEDEGDCIYLRQELIPTTLEKFRPHRKGVDDIDAEGFTRILPKSWKIDKWIKSPKECQDLAIILRRTHKTAAGVRQVRFVLAGFTEVGTAVAGAYLADRWQDLWKKYVRDNLKANSQGDFLAVIGGPSDSASVEDWGEDPGFPAITAAVVSKLGGEYAWSATV